VVAQLSLSFDPEQRPSFSLITQELKPVLQKMQQSSRVSFFSFLLFAALLCNVRASLLSAVPLMPGFILCATARTQAGALTSSATASGWTLSQQLTATWTSLLTRVYPLLQHIAGEPRSQGPAAEEVKEQ
jgi:hypothetical protein